MQYRDIDSHIPLVVRWITKLNYPMIIEDFLAEVPSYVGKSNEDDWFINLDYLSGLYDFDDLETCAQMIVNEFVIHMKCLGTVVPYPESIKFIIHNTLFEIMLDTPRLHEINDIDPMDHSMVDIDDSALYDFPVDVITSFYTPMLSRKVH